MQVKRASTIRVNEDANRDRFAERGSGAVSELRDELHIFDKAQVPGSAERQPVSAVQQHVQ